MLGAEWKGRFKAIGLGLVLAFGALASLEIALLLRGDVPDKRVEQPVPVLSKAPGKFAVRAVMPLRPADPRPFRTPGYIPWLLAPIERTPNDFYYRDPESGFWAGGRPSAVFHTIYRLKTGEKLVDVNYGFDEFRRRVVPGQDRARRKFAAFFGCSFTFGEAVNDDETLPFFFSRADQSFHAYDYGMPGWGTANVWLKIRNHDFHREIKESAGIGVYVYADFHLQRNSGSMSIMFRDGLKRPYVELGADGEPELKGTFESARPITTRFYQILAASRIWRLAKRDLPGIRDWNLRLAARMIHSMAAEFEKKTGGKFYVLLYPQGYQSLLVPYLEKEGIRYLDLSGRDLVYDLADPDHIPFEGHPTPQSYRWIAGILANSLRKDQSPECQSYPCSAQ